MDSMKKDDKRVGVEISYLNSDLRVVSKRRYGLKEYVSLVRLDLLRVIADVEDLCYKVHDGAPKSMWREDVSDIFQRVRHKLLDKAGEIDRLPNVLVFSDSDMVSLDGDNVEILDDEMKKDMDSKSVKRVVEELFGTVIE